MMPWELLFCVDSGFSMEILNGNVLLARTFAQLIHEKEVEYFCCKKIP